ncbi:hypothetical protein HY214_01815 [Candidatus Roizmanbacteria bacterium]|nr:hypothetical protein [Candidatus Roizmanbacteria bacterium]
MPDKKVVMFGLTVGSLVGSFVPTLWGVSAFSYTSVFAGAVGGLIGILVAYKLISS